MAVPAPRRVARGAAVARYRARQRRRAVLLWCTTAVVVGAVAFTGGLFSAPIDLKAPVEPRSVVLLSTDGRVVASLLPPQDKQLVPSDDIPAVLRLAVVAAEDKSFFEHRGVDPLAIVRAAYRDITGSRTQGGSTITQQYVKNVYVGRQRTILRKVREAALAVRLEKRLSKDEILTAYLNEVYLGNSTYGVQAASKFYFGVPVKDLDKDPLTNERSPTLALARAAMLAGIIPAPSAREPVDHMPTARTLQLGVLNRMVNDRLITSTQASAAFGARPPVLVKARRPHPRTVAPEFRDLVRRELQKRFDQDEIDKGGLRVKTTLDLDLQNAVVSAVGSILDEPDDPQAAVVAIDPRTGDIRAMTTRRVTDKQRGYSSGGFNLATDARRQIGSTIKPFTLAAALMNGHKLTERRPAPRRVSLPNPGGAPNPYVVRNAEGGGRGSLSIAEALVKSVNTVYVPLARDVGIKKVLAVAGNAGLGPRENLRPNLSAGLGALDLSPLSVANGFATLVNHGVRQLPRSVLEVRIDGEGGVRDGAVVMRASAKPKGSRVVPTTVADAVTDVMEDVVRRGTATRARQDYPVYGKTGTTNDITNAWFVGCTRQLCIATWMGYEKACLRVSKGKCVKPNSMRGVAGTRTVYGGTVPARIFAETLQRYEKLKEADGDVRVLTSPTPKPRRTAAGPREPERTATARPRATTPAPTAAPSTDPEPTPTEAPLPIPTIGPTSSPGPEPEPGAPP